MTPSAAAIFFWKRSNLRAVAIALSLAAVATMPVRLGGAEPDFERAEIWVGGQCVQSATAPAELGQRAVIYIDGRRIDPHARAMPTPAPAATPTAVPQSQQPAALPALSPQKHAPIESNGPLVIEFPTPALVPAPAPATTPVPDEAAVAPATPSLAARQSSGEVQPAVLNVPHGASPSNVALAARFSVANEPQAIAPLAVETPQQAPTLLSDAQRQTSWPVQPAPLFAEAPAPRPHVGRVNLSPAIFFWPLVIGLLLVFYVQRLAAKKRRT